MADSEEVETVDETTINEDEQEVEVSEVLSPEDKARADAEARRKRIQEKAGQRLATVSGEQTLNEEDKKASASKAARIRAARQRRYGKKSTATTPTAAASPAPAPAPTETDETTETVTPVVSNTETKTETTTDAEKSEPTESAAADTDATGTPAAATKSVPSPAETATASATTTTSSKKYQGVAKMRRKMIAKKKAEEAKGEEEAPSTSGTSSVAATSSTSTTTTAAAKSKKKKVALFPIMMHFFTIMLLFGAGLDVGLQQFNGGGSTDTTDGLQIHTKTALEEYGIPFLQRNPFEPLVPLQDTGSTTVDDAKRALEEEYLSSTGDSSTDGSRSEFMDEEDGEYVPNIDPLFQVDLDELTKGPGFFNQVARGAVSIHRMILWLVYFTPMAFMTRLLSIPYALMDSPPVLFVAALLLRQVVGKVILGARLPDPSEQEEDGEKNNIDVLNMAKNFVKNFFATSFPTAVTLYDAFTHLRSDMYIALCGVFIGIAWTHLQLGTAPIGTSSLPVEEPIDTTTSATGDEL